MRRNCESDLEIVGFEDSTTTEYYRMVYNGLDDLDREVSRVKVEFPQRRGG